MWSGSSIVPGRTVPVMSCIYFVTGHHRNYEKFNSWSWHENLKESEKDMELNRLLAVNE
jgi:hypothetical protein